MIKSEYRICGSADITIAVVADLHEHEPSEVIEILKDVNPDVIAVPGDLFENYKYGEHQDCYDTSYSSKILCACIHLAERIARMRKRERQDVKREYAYDFLRAANAISPVVLSLGNHELNLTNEDKVVLDETRTVLLNNGCAEIKNVVFGGIPSKQCTGEIDMDFLKEFRKTDKYKVLLCHHPEYYKQIAQYTDLVISGHCHGGQIRLFGRGIFAPGQGLFPKYHHGVYGKMVVSAGCSNTSSIPRIGNPTEVVVIRIAADIDDSII